jgi:hypothetical protein
MRKLVIASSLGLILSGVVLTGMEWWEWERQTAIALGHMWVGFFFIVIFPMYSWDHIQGHSYRLREWSWVMVSGMLQLISGLGLILTGVILWLWGREAFELPRTLHIGLTLVISAALLIHYRARK